MAESEPPGCDVVVVIVTYHSRDVIDACLRTLAESDDSGLRVRVVVADNASSDGTADQIEAAHPRVTLLRLPHNVGFAAGNNRAWEYADQRDRPRYLALLNPDTEVASGWLRAAADYLDAHPTVAAVQPKLLLHDGARRINRFNSAGNRSHYLGFGFVTAFGEEDRGQFDTPRPIDFPSGAACVLRADAVRQLGLFDDRFFMYLEDMDLGWKLRWAGHEVHYLPTATVWHRYTPGGAARHYRHYERNRWAILLTYLRPGTLALLLPAIILLELTQLIFALAGGRVTEKISACRECVSPDGRAWLLDRRAALLPVGRVKDTALLVSATRKMGYPLNLSAGVRWVLDPLLRLTIFPARILLGVACGGCR